MSDWKSEDDDGTAPGTELAAARERLAVTIGKDAIVIAQTAEDGAPCQLRLTPGDALMLLDILQNESERLEEMAAEAAPIPIRFDFRE
jgi:hypothetical protein